MQLSPPRLLRQRRTAAPTSPTSPSVRESAVALALALPESPARGQLRWTSGIESSVLCGTSVGLSRTCAISEQASPQSASTPNMTRSFSAAEFAVESPPQSPSSSIMLQLPAVQRNRSSSCSSAVSSRGVTQLASCIRTRLCITAVAHTDDIEIAVDLAEGQPVGSSEAFPCPLPADGTESSMELRSSRAIVGTITVSGSNPIPFGIQVPHNRAARMAGEGRNFVYDEDKSRASVTHAGELEAGPGRHVKGEGFVVSLVVSDGAHAEMRINIQPAKRKELARLAQERALLTAMEKKKYSTLLAQISKSRTRRVGTTLIDDAKTLLRSLAPAEGSVLDHGQIKKMMKWKKVTTPSSLSDVIEDCPDCAACPCNQGYAQDGEICDIYDGTVDAALEGLVPQGVGADEWLFKALVKAAAAVPEGCVWKSGGKFLLTNEERNQAPTAIVSLLERNCCGGDDSNAGRGIRALVGYTEKEFGFRVTAVQINLHPNEKSSHKQHRDIYGASQKGGLNCTCSFMKCQGTVCYSLGSSRQVLCETMQDSRSKYNSCGDTCEGRKVLRYMHSGCSMYFNDKWNTSHSHGIPTATEACGPRISVALLCA